jgi:8-oxo-dGTP pyrophosphatase MutT (NUDIX family)
MSSFADRYNGFGGKVESSDASVLDAALRELSEEACIHGTDAKLHARILFEFEDDPTILDVRVFRVTEYTGVPEETEEMAPRWFKVEDIPYDRMVSSAPRPTNALAQPPGARSGLTIDSGSPACSPAKCSARTFCSAPRRRL